MLLVTFVAGGALSPGTLTGDASRMLVTFLGLVSASVLPTITLIVNSMTASSRSVKALGALRMELSNAMNALFALLFLVGLVVAGLFALAIPPAALVINAWAPAAEWLPRAGQGFVAAATSLVLCRTWQFPAILRRSLDIRYTIAAEEAKARTLENVAKVPDAKSAFATPAGYGKIVSVENFLKKD